MRRASAVRFADENLVASVKQPAGLLQVGGDNVIGNVLPGQVFNQPGCDRVEMGDNDMSLHAFWQCTRGTGPFLGLEPRVVEELDEGKRQHDEQKKSLLITAFAAVEKIGGNISQDNSENDGLKGDANRSNEDSGIEKIFEEFGVIAELKGGDVRSAGGAQPEAVNDDEADRYDQE